MEDIGAGSETGEVEEAGSNAAAEPDPLVEALETDKPAAKQSHARAINTAKWAKGEKAMDALIAANPIRPKGDSEDKAPAAKAGDAPASDGPQRDPATGRFTTTSATKIEGQEAPPETKAEGQAPATPSPETTSPQPKIKVGGRDFESPAAADTYVSTLEWHVTQASQSAEAWKAEAERLRAEGGKAPAPTEPTVQAETPAGIDEDLAATMWQIANEKGRPDLYFNWRAAEEAKLVETRMQSQLEQLFAPHVAAAEAEQAKQAEQAEVRGVFDNLRQYRAGDGSAAFPEVDNPATVYEMGQLLEQLGYTTAQLRTPTGMAAAIYTYRGWKAGFPVAIAAPVASPAQQALPSDAAAVATGTEVPFNRSDAPDGLSQEARWLRNSLALSRPTRVAASANGGRPVELGFSRR